MVNCKWATFAVSVILTMTLLAASGDLNANETLRNAAKHQNQLWRLLKNLGQRRTNIQLSSKLFDRLPTNVEKTYTPVISYSRSMTKRTMTCKIRRTEFFFAAPVDCEPWISGGDSQSNDR